MMTKWKHIFSAIFFLIHVYNKLSLHVKQLCSLLDNFAKISLFKVVIKSNTVSPAQPDIHFSLTMSITHRQIYKNVLPTFS